MLDRRGCSPACSDFGYSGFMTSFHEFVTQLLREGKVVFRSARAPRDRPRPQDIALLEKAFEDLPAVGGGARRFPLTRRWATPRRS